MPDFQKRPEYLLDACDNCSCDRRSRRNDYPPPLTSDVLSAAHAELPSGASLALETCVRCRREGRLSADEVVGTARSFAGSSPTLTRALASPRSDAAAALLRAGGGEIATPEEMDELARLAKRRRPA